MNIADVDGDGSISFNEFFFFVLVCQIPSRHFETAFKRKGGKINAKDFHKLLEANRKKIPFGQNLKLTKQQKDDYMLTCQEMINNIYNGRSEITFQEWMEFRNELQEMIWHYEFHQFDLDPHGHMSAFDFALSFFIYYIPFHKIQEYRDHLNSYEEYHHGCVSFKQYVAFQYFLKKKNDIISRVMEKKQLDLGELRTLVDEFEEENDYCHKHSVHISDEMLDAFIHAMDLDGNGVLDEQEVVGIIYNRKTIGGQKAKKN